MTFKFQHGDRRKGEPLLKTKVPKRTWGSNVHANFIRNMWVLKDMDIAKKEVSQGGNRGLDITSKKKRREEGQERTN